MNTGTVSICLAFAGLLVAASAARATEQAEIQPRFPRETRTDAGTLVTHAPQVEAWPDYETIDARTAVEVTLKGKKPAVGAARFTAATSADMAEHTVTFYDIKVTDVRFTSAPEQDRKALEDFVRDTVRRTPEKLPLDVVLRYLEDSVIPKHNPNLAMAAPDIHYSSIPAILVITDGPALKVPIKDTSLSYVANTNWDLFFHDKEARWYLLNGKQWLQTAKDGDLSGNWELAEKLPKDFTKLPDTADFTDARAAIPPTVTDAAIPRVIASSRPAELIVTQGGPDIAAIPDSTLIYVPDTESDLFRLGDDWYYLVSGRWFTAQALTGPWSPVAALPEEFAKIPADSPRGRVRVSVPGTEEAKLAALEADIPRKAQLKRTATPGITVAYTGEPQFEQIAGLPVFRATNSPYDVLRVGTSYYLCYNAAWWVATSATGPWAPATSVPAEIYKIPPTSPAYHVTQVKIYGYDNQTVTTGYTAGYSGVYTTSTTIVYGTGYYYPPYMYYGYYPAYYWYPVSYGRSSWYNPSTGNFGGAESIYGPYGGAGRAAVYNPETGTYGRARAVWDSDEIAMQGGAYNPRTGNGFYTDRYRNEEGSWGNSLITRGDQWVKTQGEFSNGSGKVDFQTSRGTEGTTNLKREGDTVKGDTTVTRGDKTLTSEGTWTKEGGSGSFETSGGASGEFNREFEDGKITGSSEITKGDQTATTKMVRTEEGVARQVTGSGGEQVTVAYDRSEGDLYASKDGEVYKRGENGWQQREGDSWKPVEKPEGAPAATSTSTRNAGAGNRKAGEAAATQLPAASGGRGGEPGGATAGTRAAQDMSGSRSLPSADNFGTRERAGDASTRDSQRTQDLNRDYRARSDGYRSYDQRRSSTRSFQGGRPRRR